MATMTMTPARRREKTEKASVTSRVETITPAKAKEMLERSRGNRKIRQRKVAEFAQAMSDGEWEVTSNGIGIDADGYTVDGFHRLHAIIASGVTVRMVVARGLGRRSVYVTDIGTVRDVVDVARFAGVQHEITTAMVSTARAMIDSLHKSRQFRSTFYTRQQIIDYILEHYEAITYACSIDFGKINHAAFRAVAARAWYTADRGLLAEFLDVLASGFFKNEGGEWPIKLREHYLSARGATGGHAYRRSLYAKTERALKMFLDGASFTRLCEAQEELFRTKDEGDDDSDVAA